MIVHALTLTPFPKVDCRHPKCYHMSPPFQLYRVSRLKIYANKTCTILTKARRFLLKSDEISQIILVVPQIDNFSNFVWGIIKVLIIISSENPEGLLLYLTEL